MIDPIYLKPKLGDKSPMATLIYGESFLDAPLNDESVHMMCAEFPVPGQSDGTAVQWPKFSYSPFVGAKPLKISAQVEVLGMEETVEDFIGHCVLIMRKAQQVLRKDGTAWIYVRDRYLDNKQLGLIPSRVALALQADGWILRNEVIWAPDNPTGFGSHTDRLSHSHGTLFLLAHPESKGKYFYNADPLREAHKSKDEKHIKGYNKDTVMAAGWAKRPDLEKAWHPKGKNKGTVWRVNLGSYLGKAVSPWPYALVEPMVLASTPAKGVCSVCGTPPRKEGDCWILSCGHNEGFVPATVLDPFSGTATTGSAALDNGRNYVGVDTNLAALPEAKSRLEGISQSRKVRQRGEATPVLDMFKVEQ